MDTLNIDKEKKNENNNNENTKKEVNKKIKIKKLCFKQLIEKIDENEIYVDEPPPTTPSRGKIEKTKRKFAKSSRGIHSISQKEETSSLFNIESKSDDEENKNDNLMEDREEYEGRKSIYSNSDESKILNELQIFDIFDNTQYIKKLEEKWKYEKILLDYNIIDFTSK
jgi:hypothetical protein